MVQFGAKQVKAKEWDQNATTATTSRICALTLWRQDWTEKEWDVATNQTSQFLKDIFALEGLNGAITSVWGRSFRRGNQPTTNKDATSVQVHVAIIEEHFLPLLKLTGYNRVWAAPKAEDGRLIDDFRILWLPAGIDIQKASALIAKLTGVCGLVRGKSSLGARVNSSMFSTAWSIVYPQEPVPADVSNKWVYKLEPLPYGCNSKMLIEWSQHVKWPLRPLRATGPKNWLVRTGDEPPEGPLAFTMGIQFCHDSCPRNIIHCNNLSLRAAFLGCAQRIGEASHPGPKQKPECLLNFVIANPTSILHKRSTFDQLFKEECVQILCLPETSATADVQRKVQKDLATMQCKAMWSNPVPPQRVCIDGDPSARGRAGGDGDILKDHSPSLQKPIAKRVAVADQLANFWKPLWQAEHDITANQPWPEFDSLMQILPTPPEVFLFENSLQAWEQATEGLRASSARGFDAVSAQELKMLPDALLLDLISVLDSYKNGFPGYFVVVQAFRAAMHWLSLQTPHTCQQFFRIASSFTGCTRNTKGPATTLKHYMTQFACTIDKQGYVMFDGMSRVHLVRDIFRRMKLFIDRAWQKQLILTHTARFSQINLPDISRTDTVAILSKFKDNDRRQLLRELAGAIHAHPDHDFHHMLHFQQSQPVIAPELKQFAETRFLMNQPCHVYTDGSCKQPASPTTRYAAFAGVIDTAVRPAKT
eukprot:s1077_g2.t1